MRELLVADELLTMAHEKARGSFSYVAKSDGLTELLGDAYVRDGLCLKVYDIHKRTGKEHHRRSASIDLECDAPVVWGAALHESSQIQNIVAWFGLAPRIYDIVRLRPCGLVAQVTDFVDGDEAVTDNDYSALWTVLEGAGAMTRDRRSAWDLKPRNWVARKLVDFSGIAFSDISAYKSAVVERACTRRGRNIGAAYQRVDGLGIHGSRDMEHRVKAMRLDDEDFVGKTVLDIGCNLGQFCLYATRCGATRVVGVDKPSVAFLAHEIANLEGAWTIDYIGARLPDERGKIDEHGPSEFDIVFALAIFNHMTLHQGAQDAWMVNLCKPGGLFYLEGHGGDSRERYEAALQRDFSHVQFLGFTTDNYTRPLWRCAR